MPRGRRRAALSSRSVAIVAAIVIVASSVVNFHLAARLDRHLLAAGGAAAAADGDGANSRIVDIFREAGVIRSDNDKERVSANKNAFGGSNARNSTTADHKSIVEMFREAGVELDAPSIELLPTWSQIESIIGPEPKMIGLDRCAEFQEAVPPLRRMLGSAGMFNSGTNLVTHLMQGNCKIPERYEKWGPLASRESWGIRWQCPWGKHTPVKFKYNHTAPKNENVPKDDCLPIVTIRNPFDWMEAMCKNPYTLRWGMQPDGRNSQTICPNLVDENNEPQTLIANYSGSWFFYDSLAHLWNEWYAQYWREANFPFLMVRLEDLVFRQYETTKMLCECAGGEVPPKDKFLYIVNSAKVGAGHGEDRTGMVDAWMKFGKPPDAKAGFRDEDWEASLKFLDRELMEKLGYEFPPPE